MCPRTSDQPASDALRPVLVADADEVERSAAISLDRESSGGRSLDRRRGSASGVALVRGDAPVASAACECRRTGERDVQVPAWIRRAGTDHDVRTALQGSGRGVDGRLAGGAGRPGGAGVARIALVALRTLGTLRACGTVGAIVTLHPLVTLEPGEPLWTGVALGAW